MQKVPGQPSTHNVTSHLAGTAREPISNILRAYLNVNPNGPVIEELYQKGLNDPDVRAIAEQMGFELPAGTQGVNAGVVDAKIGEPVKRARVIPVDPSIIVDDDGSPIDLKNTAKLRSWLLNTYEGQKITVADDGKRLLLSEDGIRASVKRRGKRHRQAYAALDRLLEESAYDGIEPGDMQHPWIERQDVYYSAAKIGNDIYSIRFKIDVPKDGSPRYYKDHRITEIEIAPSLYRGLAAKGGDTPQTEGATNANVMAPSLYRTESQEGSRTQNEGTIDFISLPVLKGLVKPTQLIIDTLYQSDEAASLNSPRGAIRFQSAADAPTVIKIFKNADVSTVVHELNHLFVFDLQQMVAAGRGGEKAKAELAALTAFAGGKLDRAGFEKIAGAWERYAMEGRAPSSELEDAFGTFRKYISHIYRNATENHLVEPSPEVRRVFDSFLATDEQIDAAARQRAAADDWTKAGSAGDKAKAAVDRIFARKDERARKRADARTGGGRQMRNNTRLEAIRRAVQNEMAAEPAYRALDLARAKGGVNRESAVAVIGEEAVKIIEERHGKDVFAADASPGGNLYQGSMPGPDDIRAGDAALKRDVAAWGGVVDDFMNGVLAKRKPVVMLNQTPLVLQMLGAKNLPVNTSYNILEKILVNKHHLLPEAVKQIPAALADPIMVFRSGTHGGDLVVMLELKDQHGATVIVPLGLEQPAGHEYKVNFVFSAYGKRNEGVIKPNNKWFVEQSRHGMLLYRNMKKSRDWARTTGLQLPGVISPNRGNNSIRTESDLVKLRERNPTLYQSGLDFSAVAERDGAHSGTAVTEAAALGGIAATAGYGQDVPAMLAEMAEAAAFESEADAEAQRRVDMADLEEDLSADAQDLREGVDHETDDALGAADSHSPGDMIGAQQMDADTADMYKEVEAAIEDETTDGGRKSAPQETTQALADWRGTQAALRLIAQGDAFGKLNRFGTDLRSYRAARARARRNAFAAAKRGDRAGVTRWKKQEIYHHCQIAAAKKARALRERILSKYSVHALEAAIEGRDNQVKIEYEYAQALAQVASYAGMAESRYLKALAGDTLNAAELILPKEKSDPDGPAVDIAKTLPDWLIAKERPADFRDFRDFTTDQLIEIDRLMRWLIDHGRGTLNGTEERGTANHGQLMTKPSTHITP